MKFHSSKVRGLLALFLLLFVFITACGSAASGDDYPVTSSSGSSGDTRGSSDTASNVKGTWDNTSVVLVPSADGTETNACDVATIDSSNSSEGYIMVNYTGSNQKVKLQLTGPDQITYTYDLHGGYEVFPLTAGNGSYTVAVFENVQDTQYATVLSTSINANITNEFGPYLYPNQYVNFSASSLPVSKAVDLAYSANNEVDVIANVYNYIIENFTYDYDKAATVQSGYLPDVDQIFQINTGICFDYASVMATMLRSQKIPTRLEVGYKGEEYHAWISAYVKDVGWINGVIEFNGTTWKLMDPTFASTSSSPKNFTADDQSYIIKYVY